ncbi:MAG TPA: hypothetical protein VMA36_17170 [Candidatus Limnocylindria bacterium]|nr:hypothetical protein [Candidatus Limnocylindria bacterium]
MLPKKRIQLGAGLAAIGLAACGGSGTSPAGVTTAAVGANVLQFAAGTANIAGTTGLNVVVTYRQPSSGYKAGDSGSLVNSVSLTGPFTLPATAGTADPYYSTIETGPGPSEVGHSTMGSTPQTGSTTATTFGQSGQASGLGLEPYNYNNGSVPDSVAPYTLPLYDTTANDPNAFVPWGGPPAFDPNKDGEGARDLYVPQPSSGWYWGVPVGTLGISEGIDVFGGITPATSAPYTLTVTVPGQTAGTTTATQQASFTLKSTNLLGTLSTAPTVTTAADANGNTTLSVTLSSLPAGATEAYVQIADYGPDPTASSQPTSCNAASATYPAYYTLYFKGPGTQTVTGMEGPRGANGQTPSICTAGQNTAAAGATTDADTFTVQELGFDYPAYEASYPNSLSNPSPTILGAAGQDDITISPVATYAPSGTTWAATASNVRLLRQAAIRRH